MNLSVSELSMANDKIVAQKNVDIKNIQGPLSKAKVTSETVRIVPLLTDEGMVQTPVRRRSRRSVRSRRR